MSAVCLHFGGRLRTFVYSFSAVDLQFSGICLLYHHILAVCLQLSVYFLGAKIQIQYPM